MYLFYVDESGNLDINNQASWLYTMTAVGIFEHKWPKFYMPIVQHKRGLVAKIRERTGLQLQLHDCEVKSRVLTKECFNIFPLPVDVESRKKSHSQVHHA